MYYPFHLSHAARVQQPHRLTRPAGPADIRQAQATAAEVLGRFPGDWAHILRSELVATTIGAALPLLGFLVFGWPLILLSLSVLCDGLALWAAEAFRRQRGDPRADAALDLALRCEQALEVAIALQGPARQIAAEPPSRDAITLFEHSTLGFVLIAMAVLLGPALEQAGLTAVLSVALGALLPRLLELRQQRAPPGGAAAPGGAQIAYRPRSPETLLRLFLILFGGLVVHHGLSALGASPLTREIALLLAYLLICLGLALWWRHIARQGLQHLHRLDALPRPAEATGAQAGPG